MQKAGKIRIQASVLRSCAIAYADFVGRLTRYADGSSKLERHLSTPENYNVVITSNKLNDVIEFVPGRLEGELIKGGVVRYEVSRQDSSIVKVETVK
jgi:hypothetical protein